MNLKSKNIHHHKVPKIRAGDTGVVFSLYVTNAIDRVKDSYRIYKTKQLISAIRKQCDDRLTIKWAPLSIASKLSMPIYIDKME